MKPSVVLYDIFLPSKPKTIRESYKGTLYVGGTLDLFEQPHQKPYRAIVSAVPEETYRRLPTIKNHFSLCLSKNDTEENVDIMKDSLYRICDFIRDHLKKGDVYVHCDSGMIESSIIVIYFFMYLIKGYNMFVRLQIYKHDYDNSPYKYCLAHLRKYRNPIFIPRHYSLMMYYLEQILFWEDDL